MKGLVIAIQFLTRLPTPRVTVDGDDFAQAIRWFPVVGLIVGLAVATATYVGCAIDVWVGALFGLVVWTAITGALHLDGLGDIADAAGAAHKGPDRILSVLNDPHLGSFGAITIGLQLIAKLILLRAMLQEELLTALILIPFAARMGPLLWSRILPPLHAGLGARFANSVRPIDFAIWGSALLIAAWFVPALLVAPVAMLGWASWVRSRIGGISGDSHGAGIELVESTLLLATISLKALI